MLQFYFLSIMLNLLAGVMLVFTDDDSTIGRILETQDNLFHLVVGILSVFVAVIKLLSPVRGILFFGDFIPALAGFAGGSCLLVQYFSEKSASGVDLPEFVNQIFVENQKYIGIACFVCAVLHFICPAVLFL